MRIAIDARSLTTRPTGIGHYLMAAVNVWAGLRPDFTFLLLAHKPLHPSAADALCQWPNVEYHVRPPRLLAGNGLLWLLLTFAAQARALGATWLWGAGGVLPPFVGKRLRRLLTVHDLVYLDLPWTMSTRSRIAYGLLAGRAIKNADRLWAVSRYTAQEIARHYPRRQAVDITVGSGLNPMRRNAPGDPQALEALKARYDIGDKTLLFVGTLEPRKNLAFLLGLMPRLAPLGYRLLVVGCSGWGGDKISQLVNAPGFPASGVRFCDYIADDDLQALYRCVAFFVSTSLMEGFGLPHLEAMAAGCPVISAANSAMVEVVGMGGVLVDGWDEARWVGAIEQAFARREVLKAATGPAAAEHRMEAPCLALSHGLGDPA